MEYINKTALVAEIEKIIADETESIKSFEHSKNVSEVQRSNERIGVLTYLHSFLDTIEVKEVASMQKTIDSYKSFVFAINFMIESGEDINCPIFCKMDRNMQNIWRWVKKQKDSK